MYAHLSSSLKSFDHILTETIQRTLPLDLVSPLISLFSLSAVQKEKAECCRYVPFPKSWPQRDPSGFCNLRAWTCHLTSGWYRSLGSVTFCPLLNGHLIMLQTLSYQRWATVYGIPLALLQKWLCALNSRFLVSPCWYINEWEKKKVSKELKFRGWKTEMPYPSGPEIQLSMALKRNLEIPWS